MRQLADVDPARYNDLMLRECGLLGEDGQINHGTVLKVVQYLKELGLKVVPAKGGTDLDDDSLRSWIRDLAPMVAPALASGLARAAQPAAAAVESQPQPAPTPVVIAHPTPAPLPAPQPTVTMEDVPVSFVSRYLIHQLDGKAPEDAAAWLLSQPQAGQLVERIRQVPDEGIPALLVALGEEIPDILGAVTWMRARLDWTIAVVREIRRQSQPAETAAKISMGL